MASSVLVTGAAGFIGMHVSKKLLADGIRVVGVDDLNPYYSVDLKKDRLAQLLNHDLFNFHQVDISDKKTMDDVWYQHQNHPITKVINLAAQAGVRYSLTNPYPYVSTNVQGFLNILELCRHQEGFKHLVFASSSSVYGGNRDMPFGEEQKVASPLSLYAATKACNELMGHAYHYLYNIPMTGLRFFTVYGPWGRPDMAAFLFADQISHERPISVFNHGQMKRDFTYIDDIVQGVTSSLYRLDQKNQDTFKVYNLGNNRSEVLLDYIGHIEKSLGKKAVMNMLPLQPGDVPETFANIDEAKRDFGYVPQTTIRDGIPRFIEWYKSYYKISA